MRAPVVILADADADFRRVIAMALGADGYDVREVADGGELFDVLSPYIRSGEWAEPLDLIISAARMPRFDGLEVLQSLRAEGWNTPFVVLTAFGDPEKYSLAGQLGAAAIVAKPVEMARLLSIVHRLAPLPLVDAA